MSPSCSYACTDTPPGKCLLSATAQKFSRIEAGQGHRSRVGRADDPGTPRGFALPDDADVVEVGAQHRDALRGDAYPPEHLPRHVEDGDAAGVAIEEYGGEEGFPVAVLVRHREVRVGGEGAPGPADGAEAAEVLGGEAQQDLEQRVGR
jgi:hypothetical protein